MIGEEHGIFTTENGVINHPKRWPGVASASGDKTVKMWNVVGPRAIDAQEAFTLGRRRSIFARRISNGIGIKG